MISVTWLVAAAAPDASALAEAVFRARHVGRSAAPVEVSTDVLRWGGGARVRVTPSFDGLPIHGSSQVVAFDHTGGLQRMTGPSITLSDPTWGTLPAVEAVERAADLPLGAGTLWAPRSTEALLLVEGVPRHVWAVDLGFSAPLSTWRVWVDAIDGRVLQLDRTSHDVQGRVFDPTPVAGPPVDLELRHLHSEEVLSGTYVDAWSCTDWTIPDSIFAPSSCDALERRAVPLSGGFLYDPNEGAPDDPFTEVNLYHHVSEVAAYYDSRFGLRRNRPFTTIANFEMQNAFYGDFDGDGRADLAFGFFEGSQFGYDAEVVYHEYGHWLVARLANIPSLQADTVGLNWIGGSINEGAADVFSMLLEPDPALGEYAGLAFRDGPIRDLEEDRTCPADLEGEVHVDGEIIGALGWNLIQELGTELTGELMVGAVSAWGPDIDWTLVADSFVDAAADLRAEGVLDTTQERFVGEAVAATGMRGCPRVIPIDEGNTQYAFVLSGGLQGDLYRMPGQNQYSIEVPEGAERLIIDVGEFSGPDGLDWSVFVRKGEPVHTEPSNLANLGLGFATPTDWDWVADGTERFDQLVIDSDSVPPLQPGDTYFIAVAGRSDEGIELFDFTRGRLGIRAEFELPSEAVGACRTVSVPPSLFYSWSRR